MTTPGMTLEITQLQAATHAFNLLYNRNKNQHRHSKWWKGFSMLKRCVSKLILEIHAGDNLRAQARVIHMNQVLLPRCYPPFTQLIQDTQFSALGMTLVAELSRIWRLVAHYTDRAEDRLGPATKLVDSRDTIPFVLSEDLGEAVGRIIPSRHTDVGLHPGFAFNTPARREPDKGGEKRFDETEGTGLDATEPLNSEIELLQPKADAVIVDSKFSALSVPFKRQRQRKSINAIDDLFQGLN